MASAKTASAQVREKRLAPRYVVGPEDYAIHTGGLWRIRNISASGVFLEDRDPLPSGREIFLELHLGGERFSCQSVVRRTVPGQGMGVQFVRMPLEIHTRLERYLNTLARPAVTHPPEPHPQEAVPTAEAPGDGDGVSARLQKLTAELRSLQEELMLSQADARVLSSFRESVDDIRVTAWAVQKWLDLHQRQGDTYSVLPLLTHERIRRATQISQNLTLDIDASEVTFETEGIVELFQAIEGVYRRLARLFKK